MQDSSAILALDVGERRIGVALARMGTKFATPLITVPNDADFARKLSDMTKEYNVSTVVVGLPRGLDGQDTAQTDTVRKFMANLVPTPTVPVVWQDEATTSLKAKEELQDQKKTYAKEDVDKLAATYILEDYLQEEYGI